MNIGFVTSNPAFSQPLIDEFNRRGHDTICYQPTNDAQSHWWQLGQIKSRADRIFVDWAQPPLDDVLKHFDPDNVPVFCRAHRIEMYNDEWIKTVPWHQLTCLFFIAEHVKDRMLEKMPSHPRAVQVLPHVGIDGDFWTIDESARKWEPPYTIAMAGNLVPKKRVYTAVQLVHDLGPDFRMNYFGGSNQQGYGNVEYAQNVTDLITDLGMKDRFVSPGPVDKTRLRHEFQKAHFVISASNEEGCHTSIAEAMACGCVPLCGAWRGAAGVYPPEWLWESPRGFYELVERWEKMDADERVMLPSVMRDFVLPKYEEKRIAGMAADIVCGPVDSCSVGEWYSTEMLQHMIEQDGNQRQQSALEAVRELMPESGGRLLEIGCGTGYISRQMAAIEGVETIGQDVAEALIAWARENNPHEALFAVADATRGLPSGEFNVITLVDVIEHVQQQHHGALIMRAAAQLAPGGAMLLRFPWSEQDKQILDVKCYPKVIRRYCENAGLTIERFAPVLPYFELVARRGSA